MGIDEADDESDISIGGTDPRIDARYARGLVIGDHNTQINYNYRGTWAGGVAPAPLINVIGDVESPYRGLGWFTERDAPFFFGRDKAIATVLQQLSLSLAKQGIVIVSGVSGAGKSSLLHAGVLPRIRGEGLPGTPEAHAWPYLVLRPGHLPLDELALLTAQLAGLDAVTVGRELLQHPTQFALTASQAAFGRARTRPDEDHRLLLVVDQFERLFTQCKDERQREAFITALHAAATVRHAEGTAPAALVVLVVRADFEARCADYEQLADTIQSRYLVTAMTERQLRLAITEPAKQCGSSVDADLTEQLLREIRTHNPASAVPTHPGIMSSAGVLPLLSDALDRAWRSRAGESLSVSDYERTGGIEGAVADSAQRAYDALTPTQQAVAHKVFLRLVVPGMGGVDTADRVQRRELTRAASDVGDLDVVLDAFVNERLLTLDRDTVEISHEVLLTTWPLLRDTWLVETHADRAVQTQMRAAAAAWKDHSHDASYLYSGSVLETASATAARITADPARYAPLHEIEQQFLAAATRAHRRRTRQRRGVIGALILLVVALTAATLTAVRTSGESAHQRDIAVARQLISQSALLATTDPFGSRLTALASWRIDPSSEARYAMLAAAQNPQTALFTAHNNAVNSAVFSPDGKTLATAGGDGTVRLWDVTAHKQIGDPLAITTKAVNSVMFSPDGKNLATASGDGTVRLWDIASRTKIDEMFTGGNAVVFSPDAKILATTTSNDGVHLWDMVTHSQIGDPILGQSVLVSEVVFSPNGKILATSSSDGAVRLWDMADRHQIGDPIIRGALQESEILSNIFMFGGVIPSSVAFSPDAKVLATASGDGAVRLWDMVDRHQIGDPIAGATPFPSRAVFSPDGKILATASSDGAVRLWDVTTHHQIGGPLTGHTDTVSSAVFSPDGMFLATTSGDGTARLWDLATRHQISEPLTRTTDGFCSVVFSPDGKTLATVAYGGPVWLWDMSVRKQVGELPARITDGSCSVVFSPDGKTLATAQGDRGVRLWDVATHHVIGELPAGDTGMAYSVVFSPNGKTLATASRDGTVRLWDVATPNQIGEPLTTTDAGFCLVVFSPDGKSLATTSRDGTVRLWDVATRQLSGDPFTGHTDVVSSVVFSPDGTTLATSSFDGTARLWDIADRHEIGDRLANATSRPVEVVFSPDGKTLAVARGDHAVRLWDVAGHQIGDPLTGHTDGVNSIVFSPDGTTLATASLDRTVRLWDVATRHQIGDPLTGHTDGVNSIAFSPDGKTLATTGADGAVRLWDVGFTVNVNVVATVCNWARGAFTHDQWQRYVPIGPTRVELCP